MESWLRLWGMGRPPPRPRVGEPWVVLLADAGLPLTGDAPVLPSEDLRLGYLPDCERLHRRCILRGMFTQAFRFSARFNVSRRAAVAASLLAVTVGLSSCTRVQTQEAAPPLPQVTAAAAVARNVTEGDEFTGRLEAVQSVAVRPRVSGLIAGVSFQEGSLVRQGQVLFEV